APDATNAAGRHGRPMSSPHSAGPSTKYTSVAIASYMRAALRAGPGGRMRIHIARELDPTVGWQTPMPNATPASAGADARDSTLPTPRATSTANNTAATSSGRAGPLRSMRRPCTTDPTAIPTRTEADTVPAIA